MPVFPVFPVEWEPCFLPSLWHYEGGKFVGQTRRVHNFDSVPWSTSYSTVKVQGYVLFLFYEPEKKQKQTLQYLKNLLNLLIPTAFHEKNITIILIS